MIFFVCLGLTFTFTSLPSMRPPQTSFVVDHPFIFSIVSRNNDIVFFGRLVKF